jgi:penicillin amidase
VHEASFTPILPGVPAVASRPLPGDNETVRSAALHGMTTNAATSGSVARYVFDVGDWEGCGWVVPELADQWYAAELVPMHYDWGVIRSVSEELAVPAPDC